MKNNYQDYNLFLEFFDTFSKSGIEGITPDDPQIIELEQLMEKNNQLFYIADLILLDIPYISKGVHKMFGIKPEKVTPGFFLTTTHPDDLRRHHLARANMISLAQEIYIKKKGARIMSSNFRSVNPEGGSVNYLYQGYFLYSKVPYESVFLILVITEISDFKYIHKGFHFYNGDDRNYFRFPDEKLLMTGCAFSGTEFKILELIEQGLSSKEIAQKVFRSVNTINTHRTNILAKSGQNSITDVIREMKGKGLL